jgi:hypothetical protein
MELFKTPSNVTKEIWRWDDYAREPRVKPVAKCGHPIPMFEPEAVD